VDIFQETIFRPLGGCCALKFLYALDIDLGYLAHTPTETGVPQKNVNRENFWLKIQRVHVNNFGTNGDIITNFYPDVSRARGDNVGTIFGWLAL